MVEMVEMVEINPGLRVEKVESPLGLNLSTHPQPRIEANPIQPSGDRQVTTQRIVSNPIQSPAKQSLDPEVAHWARACRDVFGPGVKLYPDRYAHLWGGK